MHRLGRFLVLGLVVLVTLGPAMPGFAQDSGPRGKLVVGLHKSEPFVVSEAGGYSGMAVELWENAARELQAEYEYRLFPTVRDMLGALEQGAIEVAVGNITVTRERAERVDFTYPWYDGGLRLMIHPESINGFGALWDAFHDAGHLRAYAVLVLIIVFSTFALTLFDRKFHKDFPPRWRDGIAESFYAVMSVVVSGRVPSRPNLFGWVGRLIQAAWLVCGIAVLAYVTSTVTSVMTALSLETHIETLDDLTHEPIGVFAGSTAEDYVDAQGHPTVAYAGLDEAIAGLRAGAVAAIVADGPELDYHEHTRHETGVDVVGPEFAHDKYAFAVARGSALLQPISLSLIGAQQSGLFLDLRMRYFGEDD